MKWAVIVAAVAVTGCAMPTGYSEDVIPDLGLSTVEEVMQWVADHVEYWRDDVVHERPDEWQLPHQTYIWRTGDCEDHAILAVYLLERIGVEATMEIGYSPVSKSAHAWVLVGGQHWESVNGRRDEQLPAWYYARRQSIGYTQLMIEAQRRGIE